MSKKGKGVRTDTDFDIGNGKIIPATQEAFRDRAFSVPVRQEEKATLTDFRKTFAKEIDARIRESELFPTDDEVFVFIMQYFVAEKEYQRRDIDNMAKTILDVLQGRFYRDDSQVRTLLVSKKMEKRVPQNFAYVSIKKLRPTQDIDALKTSGVERSVTMFQELKSRGVL